MTNYSLEQIKTLAPSVFTTDKAAHLTDKYIQTPTSLVVEDLMNLGWVVTKLTLLNKMFWIKYGTKVRIIPDN
jgi:hypothetical protein